LEAWLHPFEDDDWDRQMKQDARPGGKLWTLAEASKKNAAEGRLVDFPAFDKK